MLENDYEIIRKIIKGDKSAFRSIMDKYGNMVFKLAYTHVNNVEDARDLTQDIFLKVYKNLKKFKPEYKFFSWLYRIALNTINTYLKKRRKRPDLVPLEKMKNILQDDSLSQQDDNEGLREMIGTFNREMRDIFILFYYEGLDIRAICDITGKSPSNIKVILHRGRNRIKEALVKEGE